MLGHAEGRADEAGEIVRVTGLTCPRCGHSSRETMPEDACRVVWLCPACDTRFTPEAGDCCVFCSYGDTPCPPLQRADGAECC